MARSPATREVLTVVAAAAAGWLAIVAVVYRLVPVEVGFDRPSRPIRAAAAHGPVALAAWEGAPRVYDELDRRARTLPREERVRVARAILEEATRAELAPLLVLAVIQVESAFDPRAVSPVGARGLMQLMTPTFREEVAAMEHRGADPFDPVTNVRAGVRYLARLVETFADVELALVAYNAGPARLRHHLGAGGVPARLLGYPRDVLREVVRLAPAGLDLPGRPQVRFGLAVAHARPLRPGALALAGVGPRGAAPVATAAALGPVVEAAAVEPSAPAPASDDASPAAAVPLAGLPATMSVQRDACVRLELGLPMSRGRDRTRAPAARSSIQA